jgi:hypothetical protein
VRARAQRGVDAALFHPALDGYGIFGVERSETARRWQLGFQLWGNYADSPLRLPMVDPMSGSRKSQVILTRQSAVELGLWLGLTDWLEAGLGAPISAQSYTSAYGSFGDAADPLFARSGFYPVDRDTNIPPPDAGPLDFRLGLKARLLRAGPFGLALAASVTSRSATRPPSQAQQRAAAAACAWMACRSARNDCGAAVEMALSSAAAAAPASTSARANSSAS